MINLSYIYQGDDLKINGNDVDNSAIISIKDKNKNEQLRKRAARIRREGLTSKDLDRSERDEIIGKIDALSPHQLRLAHEFVSALLRDDAGRSDQQSPTDNHDAVPQWADRTTGREVTPIDWIKMHYGRMVDGVWEPDGLTLADIGRSDGKLYDAYIARIRRLPKEDLELPTEPRAKTASPEKALEMKRKASRDYMRRQREKKRPAI